MKNNSLKYSRALQNNIFLLKIVFKYTPKLVCSGCIFSVLLSVSWFFEHILGFQYIMEAIENKSSFSYVIFWIAIIWILTLIQHIAQAIYNQIVYPKYNVILESQIKKMFCEKAWNIDLAYYDNSSYYNEFIWSIEEAPKRAIQVIDMIRNLLGSLLSIILSGAFFLAYDKLGLLFILVSFAGNYLLSIFLNKIKYDYLVNVKFAERKRNYFKRVFYLNDYAKELRLNPLTNKLSEEFQKSSDSIENIIKKRTKLIVVGEFIQSYIFNSFLFDGLYILYLIINIIVFRTIHFSSFLSLYRSSTSTKDSLLSISQVLTQIHESGLYIERLRKFLDTPSKVTSPTNALKMPDKINSIEFKNVCFAYDNQKEILHNISFKVKSGDRLSLVGHNGAGKTTLVKLLMRLYDVCSGEILLNGINIKEFDLNEYRSRLSVIFQNFQIFAMSLEENVKLDKCSEADKSNIIDALNKAGFSNKLVELKNVLKTQLSTEFDDEGIDLSGGERQKVAIARAFYRNSDLLILDEPSSALDPLSEYEFYGAVDNAAKDKTLITISHRLSSTKNADKILVLENGSIIESGTHDQLMDMDGVYSHMFTLQSQYYNVILSD